MKRSPEIVFAFDKDNFVYALIHYLMLASVLYLVNDWGLNRKRSR